MAGEHTLIAAPTGSGKTLTAFLASIDRLLKLSLAGELPQETRVVYVSPLRALSNDMHRNLEVPLAELSALAEAEGLPPLNIQIGLRTGDTPSSKRMALVRKPPHILVTTPESLYLVLTGSKSRKTLQNVDTLIIDELHALVRDKRGSHLALTLERLAAHCSGTPQRIGLSATQRPIERTARFLIGATPGHAQTTVPPTSVTSQTESIHAECAIIDVGHRRALDLAIETPPSELGAVCTHEQWAEVNARVVELVNSHRSTLIFVNTRRMAERVTHQLSELLGEDQVSSHHGSLAADMRHDTEQRLKAGQLKAVVATASLELGLDVGYIDLVIQLGSPRSIAAFLQRVGRSGHALGLVPKGRLFALSRDELMECIALLRAIRAGRLDAVSIPVAPLDILAQQLVAELAHEEWQTDDLFDMVRRADPYSALDRTMFDRVINMLSEGISSTSGRSRVYLHHDQVQRRVRARKGASIAATSGGGAIPEIATYRVVAEPERTVVGTLDEDFSVESQAGDVFLLGNTSWRIQYVRGGEVTVTDAQGAPPTIPFWLGEAPGRTRELSEEVSLLREELETRIEKPAEARQWLVDEASVTPEAAEQVVIYAAAQKAAIGLLPTQKRVVFERFFDESGGMQLVIHAPFGGRITRAWGFALRKRFCRSFDFELQATADDDGIILSLGPQHSFPLESMFGMLTPDNARGLLEQAMLAVPLFQTRWRWNVTRSLLVMRQQNGKKVPPPLQRFRADDLLTAVFPAATGCKEEIVGDIPVPDHPLTIQTMEDCLNEPLDIDGLREVLGMVASGEITFIARDTREPSPFSYELLNSNPYAFLDGGEIQERRARAVSTRRSLTVESVSDLGRLDPVAIEQVRRDAQPQVRNADELHDALLSRILIPTSEVPDWQRWYEELARDRRATVITIANGQQYWAAAERLPAVRAVFPDADGINSLTVPEGVRTDWSDVEARVAMVRGWIEISGPTVTAEVAERIGITAGQAAAALEGLEGEGVVLRGHFTPALRTPWDQQQEAAVETATGKENDIARTDEWCHRRLLARIHRLTLEGLRRQIQPVGVETFIRFLTRHHGLLEGSRQSGTNGLFQAISLLQGIDAPGMSWERELLPSRVEGYLPEQLDELCLTGEVSWGRLFPPKRNPEKSRPLASLTRVAPMSLFLRADLEWLAALGPVPDRETLSSPAVEILELLEQRGAMFAADLLRNTRLLPAQLDDVLGELIAQGLVNSDGFAGLRQLIAEKKETSIRDRIRPRRGTVRERNGSSAVGRWSLWRPDSLPENSTIPSDTVEQWAWQLLRRWGVLFRDLLNREQGAPRWWELLQVLRKLEARGEIRGGRFISGVGGEQFALGDTVKQLRHLRDAGPKQEVVIVSGADPLNLVGILTDQPRITSTAATRIAYIDGVAVASWQGQEIHQLGPVPPALRHEVAQRLMGRPFEPEPPTKNTTPLPVLTS